MPKMDFVFDSFQILCRQPAQSMNFILSSSLKSAASSLNTLVIDLNEVGEPLSYAFSNTSTQLIFSFSRGVSSGAFEEGMRAHSSVVGLCRSSS